MIPAQTAADSLDMVLRLMEQHIAADTAQARALAGQTKYDSTVLIAVVGAISTFLTGLTGVLASYFSKKIGAIAKETAEQTQGIEAISVKVNGQLDRALARVAEMQAELDSLKTTGTDAAVREIADLHRKLDLALGEIASLSAKLPGGAP